jgi:uncharacterized membrane protein
MSNFLWGILWLTAGLFITQNQIKVFKKKEQSKYGYDLRLLLLGLFMIMIGIFFIFDIGTPINPHK